MKKLTLGLVDVGDAYEGIELFSRNNWTDGFPIVPPTEEKVRQFLDYVELEPDTIIGAVPERNSAVTAEMIAANAVMAGCLPEYLPVVVAAVRAVTDEKFHFNHLASMGSPWPLLIVNGPVAKKLNFNSGMYLFGPGNKANATVGRALSLVLWNCLDAKPGGVQRGNMGHAARWGFCIAENEDTPWDPLHVIEGFDRNTNTVTALSTFDPPHTIRSYYRLPKPILDNVCFLMAVGEFVRGCHLLVVNPYMVNQVFVTQGWSKQAVMEYIEDNCRLSVADLKRISRWGWWGEYIAKEPPAIEPGDESHFIYLFRDPPGQEEYLDLVLPEPMRERRKGVMLVVGGGNAGNMWCVQRPYPIASNPVTKIIELPK